MWFTHKNDIVKGIVCRNNNISVVEVKQVFHINNIWVFIYFLNIDVARVLIDPLSLLLLICIHRFRNSIYFFLTFRPLSDIILDGIHKNVDVMFPIYGFRLTIFRPLANTSTSRREVLFIMLISPVITWAVALYTRRQKLSTTLYFYWYIFFFYINTVKTIK